MTIRPITGFQFAVIAWLLAPALANARPDPLDPTTPVPPMVYSSALSAAPALPGTTVGSWQHANETVNRIGGWRVYGREAPEPASPAAAPTPPTVPAPTAPTPVHRHR